MRATVRTTVGLSALAALAAPSWDDAAGRFGLLVRTAAAQAGAPAGRPATTPGDGKKPQVRTYSSVTVVDDPQRVPPLPTRRRADGAAPERRDRPQPSPSPELRAPAPAPADPPAGALAEPRPVKATPEPALLPAPPSPAEPRRIAEPGAPAAGQTPAAIDKSDLAQLRRELHELRRELREPRVRENEAIHERVKLREEKQAGRAAERPTHEPRRGARE
jgi:hypothetical protein